MPRSIATPPGWDASPSQGYPPAVCRRYPLIQPECDGRRLNPGPPDPEFEVLTTRTHTPPLLQYTL